MQPTTNISTAKTTHHLLPAEYANAIGGEMIKEGFITSPRFIPAMQIQRELLRRTGVYRLLVEIMADLD